MTEGGLIAPVGVNPFIVHPLIRLLCAEIIGLIFAVYARQVSKDKRPGLSRILFLAPIVVGNVVQAIFFNFRTEPLYAFFVGFNKIWLQNYKVMCLALNRGPLTLPLTPAQFIAVFCSPVVPLTEDHTKHGKSQNKLVTYKTDVMIVVRNVSIKLVLSVCIAAALANFTFHHYVEQYMLSFGLYFVMGMCMDTYAFILTQFIGVELAPHFNQPYIALSIKQFWSKRWNLVAGGILRQLVYDPISENRLVYDDNVAPKPPSALRRYVAMQTTFIFSGLMHYCLLWCWVGRADYRWILFFVLQAPLIALETIIKFTCKQHDIKLPAPVRFAMTYAGLLIAANYLFWPPIMREIPLFIALFTGKDVHSVDL